MMFAASTTSVEFPELGIGPFTMKRYLVEDFLGFFSVAWYGLIICAGMILACILVLRNAVKKEGFEMESIPDYFIAAISVGVVGARAMYVLANLEQYDSFLEVIALWNGGIAIYGAVIAGAITVFVMARIRKQSPLKLFDAMVPGLLLAQAIGRWGNFVNGEAFGETMTTTLPWGMVVNGHGPVHPTFLYESLITFSGFLLAQFLIYRKKKFDGQMFCFYLIWYGIGRTLVEGLRTDSLMIGSLRLAQCIGLSSAVLGVILLFVFIGAQKRKSLAMEEDPSKQEMPETSKLSKEEIQETPLSENHVALQAEDKEKEHGTDH